MTDHDPAENPTATAIRRALLGLAREGSDRDRSYGALCALLLLGDATGSTNVELRKASAAAGRELGDRADVDGSAQSVRASLRTARARLREATDRVVGDRIRSDRARSDRARSDRATKGPTPGVQR